MAKSSPSTPAVLFLRSRGVAFTEHAYRYEEHGGTAVAARELQVSEHAVVKTLVMEDEARKPLIVLMHGDREVSTKDLARQVGAQDGHAVHSPTRRRVTPATWSAARRRLRRASRSRSTSSGRSSTCRPIYVNGGSRGFLLGVAPADVVRVLDATPVDVAIGG